MLHKSLAQEGRAALIAPDEISAEEIRSFSLPGISPVTSKELIWRYVFAVQVAKFLLLQASAEAAKSRDLEKHVKSIRKFLVDNGEIEDLSVTGRFWKIVEKLKGEIAFEAFSIKLKISGDVKPSAGAYATEQLDILETHLKTVASALNLNSTSKRFYLLVDQVEKVWSNDPESDLMVISLLIAAKRIPISFDFVRCLVFLRTDIYEKVRFQEGDKFRTDEFRIVWDANKLLDLALVRAQASAAQITRENLWSRIFPKSVEHEPVTAFLISMTLMRPRDIIQICNTCRDTGRRNGHDSILEGDVQQAVKMFSSWKLTDLQTEWVVNYPFLSDVLVLLANRCYLFNKAAFNEVLQLLAPDLSKRFPDFRHHLASPESVLKVLYSIGLVGVVRSGTTIYNYDVAQDQTVLAEDKEFVIHPSFRFALQLVSAVGPGPFQLDPEVLRSRFLREERYGIGADVMGPSRFGRGLMAIGRGLDELLQTLEQTSLPVDLRKEIRRDILSVQEQIGNTVHLDDEYSMRMAVVQMRDYLMTLRTSLANFDAQRALGSRLYGLLSALENLGRGGPPDVPRDAA